MPYIPTVKNEREELKLFRSRSMVAGILVFLALLLVTTRLVFLQINNYEHYTKLSQENYKKRIPIPPVRGQIYDRNGVLLADNHIEYVLEVTRDQVQDLDDELERLNELIPMTPLAIKKFKQKLRVNSRFLPVVLRPGLTEAEVATFSVHRSRFPGFEINVRMERIYPLEETAGHLIGYVGRIDKRDLKKLGKEGKKEYKGSTHIGKSGIEKFYETRLHGTSGFKEVEVDAHGKPQHVLDKEDPIAGEDLFLSLDVKLQLKAEALLQARKSNGAVVAIDPRNGEILVMASVPMYNPNLFVDGISYKNYNNLRNDPNRPLYNRALQGTYPPGSTIKPMAALAGLDEGTVTRSRSVFGRGFFQIPGVRHRYRCWKKRGHGHVSLSRGIFQSCDVYFYDLAYRMGIDRFSKSLKRFGFGRKTGIDLPHERSGIMPSAEWKKKRFDQNWYPGDTVNIGIGQGYWTATPLQLAHAVATVSMRGMRMQPHVLRGVRMSRNLPEKLVSIQQLESVAVKNPRYWDDVIKAMIHVVHGPGGTAGRSGRGAKYKFGGKTGTAQVFSVAQNKSYNASRLKKELHDHSLFVAFAPADNPKIAIATIVENAGGGSKVAAPLTRELLDAYFFPNAEAEAEAKAEKEKAAKELLDKKGKKGKKKKLSKKKSKKRKLKRSKKRRKKKSKKRVKGRRYE
ncbi:MAG: penicillin-binding protein 2 [Cocleimonas sp.]|nr:penicillin-binding protein 2 [Cocleimonas sp.]